MWGGEGGGGGGGGGVLCCFLQCFSLAKKHQPVEPVSIGHPCMGSVQYILATIEPHRHAGGRSFCAGLVKLVSLFRRPLTAMYVLFRLGSCEFHRHLLFFDDFHHLVDVGMWSTDN